MKVTQCSAPGKVLITGGYLILERPSEGAVLSLSSRFRTRVESKLHNKVSIPAFPWTIPVVLESPQFKTTVKYQMIIEDTGKTRLVTHDKPNRYVECAIRFSMMLSMKRINHKQLWECIGIGMTVIVMGDNDFYSQLDELDKRNLPHTAASLASLPRFLGVSSSLSSMRKTGLGSSAALVTSVVAAILEHVGVVDLPLVLSPVSENNSPAVDIVHNVAQFAHCLAQGKVGSGFDISSGSKVYIYFFYHFFDLYTKISSLLWKSMLYTIFEKSFRSID